MLFAATIMLTTACVDNNYDLSDVDGTVGIDVNNLTIPLEVDHLKLNQVIELEDDDEIKVVDGPNGEKIYAITKEGDFESDIISIPNFITEQPDIASVTGKLTFSNMAAVRGYKRRQSIDLESIKEQVDPIVQYDISEERTAINVVPTDVDDAIVSIEKLGLDGTYEIPLTFDSQKQILQSLPDGVGTLKIRIENLKLKIPKGLVGTFTMNGEEITENYNINTGILDLQGKSFIAYEGKIKMLVTLTDIDFDKAGEDIKFVENKFSLESDAGVLSGHLAVSIELPDNIDEFSSLELLQLAQQLDIFRENLSRCEIDYTCAPIMSALTINEFTGKVQYDIDNLDIDPVSIENLPDFLADNNTNIKLANPQVYLNITNPLAAKGYNLYAEAGLSIKAERADNQMKGPFTLNDGKLKINKANNVFCLAPDPSVRLAGYENAEPMEFTSLSDILSGDGLPTKLHINVTAPCVPTQLVSNFKLPQDFDPVVGNYYLYAPLAINAGSNIVYTETMDEWYDETMAKLTIEQVKLAADVNSRVPLSATITIKPINVKGQVISGVKTNKVKLEAGQSSKLNLLISGKIKNLDGVIIEAHLDGDGNEISPDQYLEFKNMKVTVSGQYVDEM